MSGSRQFDEVPGQTEVIPRRRGDGGMTREWLDDSQLHDLQVHQVELEMQNEELRRTQQALEASREKYADLYDFAPVAYFTFSADGLILEANLTGARLLERARASLIGHSFASHLPPESKSPYREHLRLAFATQVRQSQELALRRNDGALVWIRLDSIVAETAHGAIQCRTTISDVTSFKQADEALHEANTRLAEADRRKDEFLAMLAHELRNPLAPVRNAINILRAVGAHEPVVKRQHDTIERQVTHMARLLDDLLDVARVTRGKITLKKRPLALADVLVAVIETVTPLIRTRRQTLFFETPEGNLPIAGDPDRLAQIIGNLLINAAKYTDEGGQIWLEAAREAPAGEGDGTDAAWAVIRVRDSGVGIAPAMLPRIFDLFAQADQSLDRAQGGLGIGLTLVHNLVQLHGGTVTASSAGLGQGSEFIIRLPALPERAHEPARLPRPEPRPSGKRHGANHPRRILVVDDLTDTAGSLAELLELWGHVARVAFDGPAALELTRAFQPDVVLLDIGLPGMDGFEVARRLRQEYAGRPLRLVALTGYAQKRDRQEAQAAGFDDYLTKPVDLEALRKLLGGL